MRFDIITIFPRMFDSVLSAGVLGKALEKGLIEVKVHDLRDFTSDRHRQVDDRPFGGKPGMVLKPEPIFAAVEKVRIDLNASVYLLSPQGRKFDFRVAEELARSSQIILICGRYEGVDERVNKHLATDEISIGDYVLTGGEPAALVIIDAVSRLLPDVVGKMESVKQDSFFEGLFDYPQYTRPRDFRGMRVPEVLFSGDHKNIAQWRRKKSLEKTAKFRMDLLKEEGKLSPEDLRILDEIQREKEGKTNEPD
ncbi:MAG: tRNA (guanosine(37)-N1)-methyltransferase TrmD [Candidatus Aminicenantes bacterium]|nr:tRNA (guanosine(37)-N1)-methyltransferase TrmD [Candidatus Aminicenantes bacterium]